MKHVESREIFIGTIGAIGTVITIGTMENGKTSRRT